MNDKNTEHVTGNAALEKDLLLAQREKNRRIYTLAQMLIDKLEIDFLAAGLWRDPPIKEVPMRLYKQKRSKFWYFDVVVGSKRIRYSTKCEKKKEAEMVKALMVSKLKNDTSFEEMLNHSLQETFDKYLEECSKGIKDSYQRDVFSAQNILKCLGNLQIKDLTPEKIYNWQQKRRKTFVAKGKIISPRTVNIERAFIHRVLEIAKTQWGWLVKNPVSNIPPLPYHGIRERWFTETEEQILLLLADHQWLKDIIVFGLYTGFRKGEILSLKWNQVFLDADTPFIRLVREKSKITMDFPLVDDKLLEILHRLSALKQNPDGPVFIGEDNMPVNKSRLRYWWEKAVKKAGFNDAVFHSLRHTFATRCCRANMPDRMVMELLGQKSIKVTYQYMHPDLPMMSEKLKFLSLQK